MSNYVSLTSHAKFLFRKSYWSHTKNKLQECEVEIPEIENDMNTSPATEPKTLSSRRIGLILKEFFPMITICETFQRGNVNKKPEWETTVRAADR